MSTEERAPFQGSHSEGGHSKPPALCQGGSDSGTQLWTEPILALWCWPLVRLLQEKVLAGSSGCAWRCGGAGSSRAAFSLSSVHLVMLGSGMGQWGSAEFSLGGFGDCGLPKASCA